MKLEKNNVIITQLNSTIRNCDANYDIIAKRSSDKKYKVELKAILLD